MIVFYKWKDDWKICHTDEEVLQAEAKHSVGVLIFKTAVEVDKTAEVNNKAWYFVDVPSEPSEKGMRGLLYGCFIPKVVEDCPGLKVYRVI